MNQQVVTFHYTLKDGEGKTIDSSVGGDPLTIMEGAGQIIPGLEVELKKMKTGDKQEVTVHAADGYGVHDPKLIIKVPRSRLPAPNAKVGDRFRGGSDHHSPVFLVTEATETEVTLDGNHPLAGKDLFFSVEVTERREASKEEMDHGHAHGPGGHGHH